MNYQETLQYLYSRLPMFSSMGTSAIKPGLLNIIRFCKLLDDPQNRFRSIHIGGTNGKGSTSHMLAAILQTAGYKTGLYTSPHLRDFRERIRVNGQMIAEEQVTGFVKAQKHNIEEIEPSFFETTVAMAFDHFSKQKIDIAVVEVGLGGRLDSTNIIHPLLSVITNIGLDHVNILGNTIEQIAGEKAGIIKPGVPVVIGQKQQAIENIFTKAAAEAGSKIVFASEEWKIGLEGFEGVNKPDSGLLHVNVSEEFSDHQIFKSSNHLLLDLTGIYQLKNLATVLSTVNQLRILGFDITEDHIRIALKQVTELTGLMGRWQTLNTNPLVICDTGHNEDGIREVVKNIASTDFENLHMVIGLVKDKDIHKILNLLPKNATYYFCQPDIPRAKDVNSLLAEANAAGLKGMPYPSVQKALEAARRKAKSNDLIFVGGSTFVVAEII
jgi:dihydrofolate synthase/folylpolyglutamate synthase